MVANVQNSPPLEFDKRKFLEENSRTLLAKFRPISLLLRKDRPRGLKVAKELARLSVGKDAKIFNLRRVAYNQRSTPIAIAKSIVPLFTEVMKPIDDETVLEIIKKADIDKIVIFDRSGMNYSSVAKQKTKHPGTVIETYGLRNISPYDFAERLEELTKIVVLPRAVVIDFNAEDDDAFKKLNEFIKIIKDKGFECFVNTWPRHPSILSFICPSKERLPLLQPIVDKRLSDRELYFVGELGSEYAEELQRIFYSHRTFMS